MKHDRIHDSISRVLVGRGSDVSYTFYVALKKEKYTETDGPTERPSDL